MDKFEVVEPISAYHVNCTNCGSKLFPISNNSSSASDEEDASIAEDKKADKECHCCGKKFMVLFGC